MSVSIASSVSREEPLLGARIEGRFTRFGLFADPAQACAVRVLAREGRAAREQAMLPLGEGYFEALVPDAEAGTLYKLVVDGKELTDPYARFLPEGVHGPAQVTASSYSWRNGAGVARPLSEHVFYELHVGTFTEAGTYEGVRERLPELAALGITAIELLPVGSFPGRRGWGYEGVALYAPFAPYGSPDELRRLVDEAHGLGLAVFLDVVYNHFGPSGNYLASYSPKYFSSAYKNDWGDAPNYAHPVVRRLVVENALYWLGDFRFDGLRLDATHAIVDPSARHILEELAEAVAALEPAKALVAEDSRNDASLVCERGLDAIWADDFHHQLRVTLTGEKDGYYAAYRPGLADLARTIERGWLFEGQVFSTTGAPRGTTAEALPASAFVYCIQNHDQIGNRALGDRLSAAISPDQYRAASTLLLFLPMTPLLFMGQEWAASTPFLFFTDHDAELGRLVAEGRRGEFASFAAFADPEVRARIPDPQADATFESSRLKWEERTDGEHARVLELYRRLLSLRSSDPVLGASARAGLGAQGVGDVLVVRRGDVASGRWLLMNFGDAAVPLSELPIPATARLLLRSDLGALETREVPGHGAVIAAA